MTSAITNPVELRSRGFHALVTELGWVNAVRLLRQYETGGGDYALEPKTGEEIAAARERMRRLFEDTPLLEPRPGGEHARVAHGVQAWRRYAGAQAAQQRQRVHAGGAPRGAPSGPSRPSRGDDRPGHDGLRPPEPPLRRRRSRPRSDPSPPGSGRRPPPTVQRGCFGPMAPVDTECGGSYTRHAISTPAHLPAGERPARAKLLPETCRSERE
jgi:hypothetical protein